MLGNAGPIPDGAFKIGWNRNGELIIKKWNVSIMGPQPTYATLMSYKDVSAATRIDYEKMRDANFTNWSKREKAIIKMFLGEIKRLYVILEAQGITNVVPTYTVPEVSALLETKM